MSQVTTSKLPTPEEALSILDQGCAAAQMNRSDHVKCQMALQVLKEQVQIVAAMNGGSSSETPDKLLTEERDDGRRPS